MNNQPSRVNRVEAWRTKAFNFSLSDRMGILICRALELMMSVIMNGPNVSNAEHFVRSLEMEQKLAMECDPKSQMPIRELVYILCEGLGITIDSIIEVKSEDEEKRKTSDAAQEVHVQVESSADNRVNKSNEGHVEVLRIPKDEPKTIDNSTNNETRLSKDLPIAVKDEEEDSLFNVSTHFDGNHDETFKETPPISVHVQIDSSAENQVSKSNEDQVALLRIPKEEPKTIDTSTNNKTDCSKDHPTVVKGKQEDPLFNVSSHFDGPHYETAPSKEGIQETPHISVHVKVDSSAENQVSKSNEDQVAVLRISKEEPKTIDNSTNYETGCSKDLPTAIKDEEEDSLFNVSTHFDGPHDETAPAEGEIQETPPISHTANSAAPDDSAAAVAAVSPPQPAKPSAARPKRSAAAAAASKMGDECDDAPVAMRAKTDENVAAAASKESRSETHSGKDKTTQKTLECPLCFKASVSPLYLSAHMKSIHDKTPKEAGIVFRCACGHETVSGFHAKYNRCGRAKSTVIIKACDSKKYNGDNIGDDEENDEGVKNYKKLDKDLQCPGCDKCYDNVLSLIAHLKRVHKSTPLHAGIVFRCGCGNETVSNGHAYECAQASSAVIIKTIDSLRYKDVSKHARNKTSMFTTSNASSEGSHEDQTAAVADIAKCAKNYKKMDIDLQCPKCDKCYDNVLGLIGHLKRVHKTAPINEGIVFRCGCGHETVSNCHAYKCEQASSAEIIQAKASIRYKNDVRMQRPPNAVNAASEDDGED